MSDHDGTMILSCKKHGAPQPDGSGASLLQASKSPKLAACVGLTAGDTCKMEFKGKPAVKGRCSMSDHDGTMILSCKKHGAPQPDGSGASLLQASKSPKLAACVGLTAGD